MIQWLFQGKPQKLRPMLWLPTPHQFCEHRLTDEWIFSLKPLKLLGFSSTNVGTCPPPNISAKILYHY
jgi:hypothetical protein